MEEAKRELGRSERSGEDSTARLSLFFCLCLILAGLSLIYLTRDDIAEGAAQSADYHRAPGCTPTAVASSGLPPCQYQTMTVTAKYAEDDGNDNVYFSLGLRPPGGVEQKLKLVGPGKADLYAHVAVGSPVQTKSWQGQVLILTIPGWHCGTPDHPDAQMASAQWQTAKGGFFALLGGGGIFYGWQTYKKK